MTGSAVLDTETQTAGEGGPRGLTEQTWRRGVLALGALLVASAVLAGTAAVAASRSDGRDVAVLATARGALDAMLQIAPGDGQGAYDRMFALSTGSWQQQLAGQREQFVGAVSGAEVISRGGATTAAVAQIDDERARVLVAARGTVANTAVPAGEPRQYRAAVTLTRVDGRWLVSALDFIP